MFVPTTGTMPRPMIFFVISLGMLFLLAGCSGVDDSWERIQDEGFLRIGVDPTFPPFAVATDHTVEGIDIDLGQALAADLELEPQFSHFGYDGLYDALTTGQVDVLISALVIMPERTKDIAYTAPYFDAGLYLFFPVRDETKSEMIDLRGSSLAVELGSLGHVEALEWQKQDDTLIIYPFGSLDEVMAATVEGKADAALVDYVSGRLFLRDLSIDKPQLSYMPFKDSSEPYVLAVRIEDEKLLFELNAALARLSASGRLEAIIEQHLGP